MTSAHPRLVPWKTSDELITLRSQFFPESETTHKDQILYAKRAISKTLSYQLKANIPHSMLSTAHLKALQLRFNSLEIEIDDSLQLMSTMTIIRFVNGLLDPSQQSSFAIPLNVLAKKIGLPSWFVEVRHAGTHESLPSLEMLELCINHALNWLFENYWMKIDDNKDEDLIDVDTELDLKQREDFKALLKNYRRIRKLNINKFIKPGDSTEIGKEYWIIMKQIQAQLNVEILVDQIIPGGKLKFDQIRLMYEPLIHYLMVDETNEQTIEILEFLIFKIYQYIKFNDTNSIIKNDIELSQGKKWCNFIIIERLKLHTELKIYRIIDILGKFNIDETHDLLTKLSEVEGINEIHLEKINKKLKLMNKLQVNSQQNKEESKRLNFDIDDISNDLENLKKKMKLMKQEQNVKVKLFEQYENWEPKPFGVL